MRAYPGCCPALNDVLQRERIDRRIPLINPKHYYESILAFHNST